MRNALGMPIRDTGCRPGCEIGSSEKQKMMVVMCDEKKGEPIKAPRTLMVGGAVCLIYVDFQVEHRAYAWPGHFGRRRNKLNSHHIMQVTCRIYLKDTRRLRVHEIQIISSIIIIRRE